jgi:hypothetical protein
MTRVVSGERRQRDGALTAERTIEQHIGVIDRLGQVAA